METAETPYRVYKRGVYGKPVWAGTSLDSAQEVAQRLSKQLRSANDYEISRIRKNRPEERIATVRDGRIIWLVNY